MSDASVGISPVPGIVRAVAAAGLVPVLLVAAVLMLAAIEPRFISEVNVGNVLRNASYLAIISTGQMLVMILGGIDLSVGVVVALSSVTTSIFMGRLLAHWPDDEMAAIVVACAAALGLSALIGAVNGLLVAYTRASAFMVTLGTFSVIGGIAFYITSGIPIYGMPAAFTKAFGRGNFAHLPYAVFIGVMVVAVIALMQRHLRIGRHLYAIGGHATAARSSGVSVKALTVAAYSACSALAGLTGILITARIGSGQANLGSEFMLQSIGAAVLAGVSLRGGVGRAEMIAFSSLFLSVVANGMNLVRIESKLQTVVFGVLLLGAVMLDRRKRGATSYD